MAEISFEAFIEPWTKNSDEHPAWGMKSAETHRKKKDGSDHEYETTGRTFRTVKVSRASGIDLTQFRKGDRVKVTGQESTEGREYDGKKYYDLVVWAQTVEAADRGQSQAAKSAPANDEPWAANPPAAPAADVWNQQASFDDSDTPF